MPSPSLDIRAVSLDHPDASAMIDAVQDYYRGLYRGPDRAPVDPAEFAPPAGLFFLGYLDDLPVAMGGWRWVDPPAELAGARPVEIKRMYVEPSARGRGLARALLSHLESTALRGGADLVILSTGEPQQDAIALYRSAGYRDIPKFGYYARYDTAVHLGKWLASRETAVSAPRADGTAR